MSLNSREDKVVYKPLGYRWGVGRVCEEGATLGHEFGLGGVEV